MISVTPELKAALESPANQPLDLYEIQLSTGTVWWSTETIAWGGQNYEPKILGRTAIRRFMGKQFDSVSITLDTTDTSVTQLLLAATVEGRRMIIRKVDRTVTNDSVVIFNGRMERVSRIDESTARLEARQLLGSIDHYAPSRFFQRLCPWLFKGTECAYLGPELLCDHSWSQCSGYLNTDRFGGFRFVPHSGTFQFTEVSKKRVFFFFTRKKKTIRTATFNGVDGTPYDTPLPLVYGRAHAAGIVIQYADVGAEVRGFAAFSAGPIDELTFARANEGGITTWTNHIGNFGGVGQQISDPTIPDSYPYNLVAYLSFTVPSDIQVVDPAPLITALVHGLQINQYDQAGAFTAVGWSDNPAFVSLDFLTRSIHQGGMGLALSDVDTVAAGQSGAYCDEVITDTTGDQKIFIPTNLPPELVLGANYRRFRSTNVVGSDPKVDGPYSTFGPGDDDTSRTPDPVSARRFTLNANLAEPRKAIDILYDTLLTPWRGFATYSKEGKLQLRVEKPNPNGALTSATIAGATLFPLDDVSEFTAGDKVILGTLTVDAELAEVQTVGAGSITLLNPAANAHALGDEVLKVDAAFDDSNSIGRMEYPLSGRLQSYNRIDVTYVDAPAGFEQQTLRVNDFDHQDQEVGRIDSLDVDGSGIDSYFQAWRIGQWLLGRHRDLAKFISWRASIAATLVEIGDVVAVSAPEFGLVAVPFRVTELAYEQNDEVSLFGQIYSTGIYDDTAPQTTIDVPSVFDPSLPEALPAAPADVTAFSLSEDALIQQDGTVASGVSATLNEPALADTYTGVRLMGRNLDTNLVDGSGNPIDDWIELVDIPRNALPVFRFFSVPVTLLALRVQAWSYSEFRRNSSGPEFEVLLDGKDSPPTAPSEVHCQDTPEGATISWRGGPDRDSSHFKVAYTGDQIPFDDESITGGHIIAVVPRGDSTSERVSYSWVQPRYKGDIVGSVFTLVGVSPREWLPGGLMVETADGVFTGITAVFTYPDGTTEAIAIASNTEESVTLVSAPSQSGRVTMRLGGDDNQQRFHIQHADTSDNRSSWVPVPLCVPQAPDGTSDVAPPLVHANLPNNPFVSYWTSGFTGLSTIVEADLAKTLSGVLGVALYARSVEEAETDVDLAKAHSIRGLIEAEIEATFSEPGAGNSQVRSFIEPWSSEGLQHQDLDPSPVAEEFAWLDRSDFVLELPSAEVASVRARVRNSLGWGPWNAAVFAQFVRPGGGPVYTGDVAQRQRALVAAASSGTIIREVAEGGRHEINPSGAVTIDFPTIAPESGEKIIYVIRQGGTGYDVVFGTGFSKLGKRVVPPAANSKTVVEFIAVSPTELECERFDTFFS